MAKQLTCQRFIFKVRSSRLRKAKWKLTLPLTEARKNEELIALADSQILRWIDEMNGVVDGDEQARALKEKIRALRKEPNSLQNRKEIKKLYSQLDTLQFKADYICVIMDKGKDFIRACKGFSINGVQYVRLLGTNGGVKMKTIVFVNREKHEALDKKIQNGRNLSMEMVPAKFEAYKALVCSASTPVSMPKGVLVVHDCETSFVADTVYVDDEGQGEPFMENQEGQRVELNESDGYGLITPALARRWATELGLDYLPSGMNTRFAWEKGMVFPFDFQEFACEVAGGSYIVTDVWGNQVDIREVELILTTSMLKLWDSYESCAQYLACCQENGYCFGVTKVCPKELESQRNLNYQFIQSYQLTEEDVDLLLQPTIDELEGILSLDYRKTILFLKGVHLNEHSYNKLEDDYVKALMVEPELLADPYIQSKVYQQIRNRINEAKVGVIQVHGNYSVASGDPYSLCQSIFGLEVTGLLRSGEVYNGYWVDRGVETLACFRAPMTCHNNIRGVTVHRSDMAQHWYQYMKTCTLFNSWDTAAHALNGMDKDGDQVMLTDNEVLVRNLRPLSALLCVQRKAEKVLVTEEALIEANINSFGDDIGKITNRITSMFELQAKFPVDSVEYEILDYRIKCGQLFQQNAIDKAKGIVAKPMPKEWYDKHSVLAIEEEQKKELYLSLLSDKKPYFMRYVYPNLMREYSQYISNTNKKALREFSQPIADLISQEPEDLSEAEAEFVKYYYACMPVGMGDCTVNRICHKIEERFDSYFAKKPSPLPFDYGMMKCDAEYTKAQQSAIGKLLEDYNRRVQECVVSSKRERVDSDEMTSLLMGIQDEFRVLCDGVCSHAPTLCDILLDLCYQKPVTKGFVWNICGAEIVGNLLWRSNGCLGYPVEGVKGDISFSGKTFEFREFVLEGYV